MEFTVDAGWTTVDVYDLAGRLVTRVMNDNLGPGSHLIQWDGTAEGAILPDGLYVIHVRHAGGLSESRKLILLRNR